MRTRLTRQTEQPGTKHLVAEYGAKVVCVRYRYNETRGRRLKTVEIIVEETPYAPAAIVYKAQAIVGLREGMMR